MLENKELRPKWFKSERLGTVGEIYPNNNKCMWMYNTDLCQIHLLIISIIYHLNRYSSPQATYQKDKVKIN